MRQGGRLHRSIAPKRRAVPVRPCAWPPLCSGRSRAESRTAPGISCVLACSRPGHTLGSRVLVNTARLLNVGFDRLRRDRPSGTAGDHFSVVSPSVRRPSGSGPASTFASTRSQSSPSKNSCDLMRVIPPAPTPSLALRSGLSMLRRMLSADGESLSARTHNRSSRQG